MDRLPIVKEAFQRQISSCHQLGSPFTAAVIQACLSNLEKDGALKGILADWLRLDRDPWADALALRLAGALHALVLMGQEKGLVRCYPNDNRPGNIESLNTEIDQVFRRQQEYVTRYLASPPQTNEALRSAILLGGFMKISCEMQRPLRLLEIGASAGLNLI